MTRYCIYNTERDVVLKLAVMRSTFDTLEEAEEWMDTKGESHLEIRKLVKPENNDS